MNSKPKVLIVGPVPPPFHGVSVATYNLLTAPALAKELEIKHLDTTDRRGLENLGRLDLTNVRLALWHALAFMAILIKDRPRVVHVSISQAVLPFLRDCLFLLPAYLFRRKIIIHLHGSDFRDFYRRAPAAVRPLIRFTIRAASRVVVLGQCLLPLFEGMISNDRLTVIPNGIDDYPKSCSSDKPAETRPTILYLGSLSREKGLFDLLCAVKILSERQNEIRFLLAGAWSRASDRADAETLIRKWQLQPYVEFAGPVGMAEKYRLLQHADIFVMPSHKEGQPLALLEAICAGLPVVATRTGSIPETLEDGISGFVVEPRDPEALAEKLLLLLADSRLRANMGTAARERFAQRYTLDRWAEAMTDLFKKVVVDT